MEIRRISLYYIHDFQEKKIPIKVIIIKNWLK